MTLHLLIDDDVETSLRNKENAGQLLVADLRRARVTVGPAPVQMLSGAKSGATNSMADLVVTGVLSGTAVTAAAGVIVAFIQRGSARSITVEKNGEKLVLTAVSVATQREIIERFLQPGSDESVGLGGVGEQ